MINNDYYSKEFHGEFELIGIGKLELEEGGAIQDCKLAVTTFGELNEARDNAVLIPTWYSGTHQIWRTNYIGPEHALNPEEYFIVCVNQIGNGLSTSPHNTDDDSISMSRFPKVRIGDDVAAQQRLLYEQFGIERLALVVGASMGAQQTYEWAVRFPDKVARAAPIAGTAQNTPHSFLFAEAISEQIWSDPGWRNGNYQSNEEVVDGLKRQAHLWSIMGFSTEFWKQEVWRGIGFDGREEFVEGFLEPYFSVMDPNDLLTMAWKWQRADVARHTNGDLSAALGRITAKTFVMPIDEDMFFPPRDCQAEAEMIPDAEVHIIEEVVGHLGLFDVNTTFMPQIDSLLGRLLHHEA